MSHLLFKGFLSGETIQSTKLFASESEKEAPSPLRHFCGGYLERKTQAGMPVAPGKEDSYYLETSQGTSGWALGVSWREKGERGESRKMSKAGDSGGVGDPDSCERAFYGGEACLYPFQDHPSYFPLRIC